MQAEYVNHMGNDLTVVNAARVSFDKHHDAFEDGDAKLISYLAKHGHWTPFSHPMITMRETVPIFVARQRFKHMVGFAYNEVSRRYVDDSPEFFTPNTWRCRPAASIKQGSGKYHPNQTKWEVAYHNYIAYCHDMYDAMIKDGVAPEQARMVLPQSMYTSYYVTGSLAAWARAYKQRIDPHAQVEIQDLAMMWNDVIEPRFPTAWAALTEE
jgi:thymidylate synthase (FAD)